MNKCRAGGGGPAGMGDVWLVIRPRKHLTSIVQIDIEQPGRLEEYLRTHGHVATGVSLSIDRLDGGVSNRTMRVVFSDGREWVVKQALRKLRVAVDWFSDPARIEREAQGLRRLTALAPPGAITPLVFEDRTHHLLAMEAVPLPHENWKVTLMAGRIDNALVEQFGELLASIHGQATTAPGALSEEFADRSHFESLRLEPYYAYAARQTSAAAGFFGQVIADTRRRRDTLVHGDYSPKNILVYRSRLVLLDHEVIHWGEPAFDVGFSLTHLLSKAHHVRPYRHCFAESAKRFWTTYRTALGNVGWADELEHRVVCHTLACLLARVAGRSPLEYLDPKEKLQQAKAAVKLMAMPPKNPTRLVDEFLEQIGPA